MCVCVCVGACMHACSCVGACVHVFVGAYMHVCVCLHSKLLIATYVLTQTKAVEPNNMAFAYYKCNLSNKACC